jgi:hypothetical protein
MKKNQLIRLTNAKSLDSFYPAQQKEIQQFIADNRIDFNKVEDVTKLLNAMSK